MKPAPEGHIRLRIDCPGYESQLVIPIASAHSVDIQEQVSDWLAMQLRYLRVFGPDEAVVVVKETLAQ